MAMRAALLRRARHTRQAGQLRHSRCPVQKQVVSHSQQGTLVTEAAPVQHQNGTFLMLQMLHFWGMRVWRLTSHGLQR